MTWSAEFVEPIELSDGLTFRTLRDAATYILKLPVADQEAKECEAAMECLILVAETNGSTMMARIAVMQALDRQVVAAGTPAIRSADSWCIVIRISTPDRCPRH